MRTSVTIEGSVTRITLDDGKVNAMSAEMLREVARRLDEARGTGGPVVISGRPGMFSAGFDLKTFSRGPEASREMVLAGTDLILKLLTYPRPVVTVCAGHAYPMGAFLMLAADVRIGVAGPWRIGMNEVAIGLTLPQFAMELGRHRLTPAGMALASTAAMFDPATALRHGYLDCVVETDAVETALAEELSRFATLDWKSYEATKARLNGAVVEAVRAAARDYKPSMAGAAAPQPSAA